MAAPGPKRKPPLQVVREGNPGKRPVREGVKVPLVEDLTEPSWGTLFPDVPVRDAEQRLADLEADLEAPFERVQAARLAVDAARGVKRARDRAKAEWTRIVPLLAKTAGLSDVDRLVVQDYCVTVARLEECERRISLDGLVVMGQRGTCRHPLTSVAAQYRTQLKTYIGELGLSPSARGRLDPPVGDDDDDPFRDD